MWELIANVSKTRRGYMDPEILIAAMGAVLMVTLVTLTPGTDMYAQAESGVSAIPSFLDLVLIIGGSVAFAGLPLVMNRVAPPHQRLTKWYGVGNYDIDMRPMLSAVLACVGFVPAYFVLSVLTGIFADVLVTTIFAISYCASFYLLSLRVIVIEKTRLDLAKRDAKVENMLGGNY